METCLDRRWREGHQEFQRMPWQKVKAKNLCKVIVSALVTQTEASGKNRLLDDKCFKPETFELQTAQPTGINVCGQH
jgi:hypothetical protein